MWSALLGPVTGIVGKVIDNVFPNETERAAAKAKLLELEQQGHLKEIEVQLSAIIAEAQSKDPWTSRARPSFLYVVYVMILASIPMGITFALQPETAQAVTLGMGAWLDAIPEEVWWLFGAGYLGYTGARTMDKRKK